MYTKCLYAFCLKTKQLNTTSNFIWNSKILVI